MVKCISLLVEEPFAVKSVSAVVTYTLNLIGTHVLCVTIKTQVIRASQWSTTQARGSIPAD